MDESIKLINRFLIKLKNFRRQISLTLNSETALPVGSALARGLGGSVMPSRGLSRAMVMLRLSYCRLQLMKEVLCVPKYRRHRHF